MRKKKQEFSMVEGKGIVKETEIFLFSSYINANGRGPVMCPYTNYIPLQYLSAAPPDGGYGGKFLNIMNIPMNGIMEKMHNTGIMWFLDRIYRDGYHYRNRPQSLTFDLFRKSLPFINEYLFYDRCIHPIEQNYIGRFWSRRRSNIIEGIDRNMGSFYQRSYGGYISPYSIYLDEDGISGRYRHDPKKTFVPHMLAVVRPEHYMWLKLNFLLTGRVDMSKVVILVDRELDTTAFPIPAFRALYREIEPTILNTSAQIWKVPLEFIKENCFLSKFELKEQNLFKRQEEIDSLVEEFYGTGIITEEEMIDYEEDERDEEEERDDYDDGDDYEEVVTSSGTGLLDRLSQTRDTITYTYRPITIQTGEQGAQSLAETLGQSGGMMLELPF